MLACSDEGGELMLDISKKDALMWFRFFDSLPEEEELTNRQIEIIYAVISQLEEAVEARRKPLIDKVRNAFTLGGRTLSSGNAEKFPKGCVSCLSGSGLTAVRKTNKCNLRCKFCYNFGAMDEQEPIGRSMWEIGGTRYRIEDIPKIIAIQGKPSGVAYVYLEPFMEIEEYYPIITEFAKAGVYQHLYTNGTLASEENLRMLGESGLNELRFNLGASNCSDRVIENMATAKRFIPSVGIETPMTPEFYESFLMKNRKIQDVAVIGIGDQRLGEISAAIIQLKEGETADEEEINNYCLELPRYKRPRKVIFADVPRNATGKIEKPLLREMYGAKNLVDKENRN